MATHPEVRRNDLESARERLQDARFRGVRRFKDQNGEEVEYRSDAEMARALLALETEIAALSQVPRLSKFIFKTSKGL